MSKTIGLISIIVGFSTYMGLYTGLYINYYFLLCKYEDLWRALTIYRFFSPCLMPKEAEFVEDQC